jgi:hypothetical protein
LTENDFVQARQHPEYDDTSLRVSDTPTSSNHVRMPSESSLLDEPIDVEQEYADDDYQVRTKGPWRFFC